MRLMRSLVVLFAVSTTLFTVGCQSASATRAAGVAPHAQWDSRADQVEHAYPVHAASGRAF